MSKTKDELIEEARRGDLFRNLKASPEYGAFIALLKDMYSEYLQRLVDSESSEARLGIKIITQILEQIDGEIAISTQAHQDLTNNVFTNQPSV